MMKKEKLVKRSAEIDKEEKIEEIEEAAENEREFLFDEEIDVHIKIKQKKIQEV
jgi:hypothetical protein